MKTALPLMILTLSVVGAHAQQPIDVVPKKNAAGAGHAACVKCSHAPCECGYSPSYYLSNPLPVRKKATAPKAGAAEEGEGVKVAMKHPPIVPHWSRPRPVPAPPANEVAKLSPEEASFLSDEAKIADYLERLEAYFAFYEIASLRGAAPERKLGFQFKRKEPITPQSLVPIPRRPSATTARDLSLNLGFETSNSLVPVPRRPSGLASITPTQTLGFEPGLVGTNPFVRPLKHSRPKRDGYHRPTRGITRGMRPIRNLRR